MKHFKKCTTRGYVFHTATVFLFLANKGMLGVFEPQCKEESVYSRKQCWTSTGYCWCVDDNGRRIGNLTRKKLSC